MNEFYDSARGVAGEKWTWLGRPSMRKSLPYPPVKVLFPSLSTVQNSVKGKLGGGTMFCLRKTWQAASFPKELFHDSNSKRGGILMHTKMVLGTWEDDKNSKKKADPYDSEDDVVLVDKSAPQRRKDIVGWCYVGSHNFTPSAWGTISGSTFEPVLNINNFELGVVFVVKSKEEADDVVSWERPPRKYDKDDIPWFQEEHISQ